MVGIDLGDMLAIYEYGRVQRNGERYTTSEPTQSSLAMIGREMGCKLPSDFVKFAKACPAYTNDFALIGDDLDAIGASYERHIILLHRHYNAGDYALLSWPNDDRRIAFHKSDPEGPIYNLEGGDFALRGVDYYLEGEKLLLRATQIAQNFREYLEEYVVYTAIGSRSSDINTVEFYKERPDHPDILESAKLRLHERVEREKFVISILKKYPSAGKLIAEIERGW